MIDNGEDKPDDFNDTWWKGLMDTRATEQAQAKSAHMRAISKDKGTGSMQVKAVERQVVSRLVSLSTTFPLVLVLFAVTSTESLQVTCHVKEHVVDDVFCSGRHARRRQMLLVTSSMAGEFPTCVHDDALFLSLCVVFLFICSSL